MGEFELIARHFTRKSRRALLGVGDDCALLQLRPGTQLAVSSDMLGAGRHFFDDVDPCSLGHKALAVNLSDLAACGARPLAFTLALSLPAVDDPWLSRFAAGLLALADTHDCELIGGDTTRGPLNICITVLGETEGGALLRSGAQVGDDVYVSGQLGDAHLALRALQGQLSLPEPLLTWARQRLERPEPRVALGLALRGVASAAIDLSDGLIGDLGHVLKASGVGATLHTGALEGRLGLLQQHEMCGQVPAGLEVLDAVLAGGDDYELAFTASPQARAAVEQASVRSATPVHRIGRIERQPGLRLVDPQGQSVDPRLRAFDHFA
jgi:thiamine-monophosphate kinase